MIILVRSIALFIGKIKYTNIYVCATNSITFYKPYANIHICIRDSNSYIQSDTNIPIWV